MDAQPLKRPVRWKRGLHRVFVVLWILWVLFLFGWLPLQQIHGAQRFATQMYALELDKQPNNEQERAALRARQDERWAQASWSHVYKMEVIPNIWLYLGAALLVPLFVYATVWGLVALVRWLLHGFTAP